MIKFFAIRKYIKISRFLWILEKYLRTIFWMVHNIFPVSLISKKKHAIKKLET